MWGTNSSPMSPAAIFLLPLPPGTPNRAPRRCMAAARPRAEPSRAGALGLPAAAAGCTGDRSRAGAGGESGPRSGSGHPGRGPAGGGGGGLLFLIQWRITGPAAASGGARRSASRSAPGRGRWRGTRRLAGLRGGGPGRAPGASARDPGAGGRRGGCSSPTPAGCGGAPAPGFLSQIVRLREGATPRQPTQRAGFEIFKTACF